MITDPIGDLLTRVRNAIQANHPKVDVPTSQLKVSIVDLWKRSGFIKNYKLFRQGEKGVLRIYLKYVAKGNPVIKGVKRVSKPGRRVYSPYKNIPKILGGLGVSIISTSSGILTDQMARENKIGGEVLCSIW
jgi:small subunit ribosomal protein S8